MTKTYILLGVLFLDPGALRRDKLVASLVDDADADLTLVTLFAQAPNEVTAVRTKGRLT